MGSVFVAITLCFLLLFFLSRGLMTIYISTLIKKRHHRIERAKGQSFGEWLTYRRYFDIIPKQEVAYLAYWGNFILYFVLLVFTIVFGFLDLLDKIREPLCSIQFVLIGGTLGIRFASLGGNRKN